MGDLEGENANEKSNGGFKYKAGDKVFFPGYGVVEINHVFNRNLGEMRGDTALYSCRVVESGLRFSVPVSNINAMGVRPLITEADILRIFTILKECSATGKVNYQRTSSDYERMHGQIRSTSYVDLAMVLGDLYVLHRMGVLSVSGQKLLKKAMDVVVTEIAEASGRDKKQISAEIHAIFYS